MLEKYFKSYEPETPPNPGLYLSAFLDDVIDLYIFHSKGSGAKALSAIQELQLLEVICSCFQDQTSNIVRCGVFYLLFGISSQDIKEGKVEISFPFEYQGDRCITLMPLQYFNFSSNLKFAKFSAVN